MNMNTNPLKVFKRFSVCFKDERIETAYWKQDTQIKPFKIFNIIIIYHLVNLVYYLIVGLLRYFGLLHSDYVDEWLIYILLSVTGILISCAHLFVFKKYPRFHNINGFIAIILTHIVIIEQDRIVAEDAISTFAYLLSVQLVIVMIFVEVITAFSVGILAQVMDVIYTIIRLSFDEKFKYKSMELFIYSGVYMTILFAIAMFGFIRCKKIIFFELYTKIKCEQSWKRMMDILPNGIIIMKDNKISYHNDLVCDLLDISLTLLDSEKIEKIFEEISNVLEFPTEYPEDKPSRLATQLDDRIIEEIHTLNNSKEISILKRKIYFETKNSFVISLKDISTLKELEASKSKIKYKGMLMATISHDMRSPANTILGMLQILKKHVPIEDIKCINIAQSSCSLLLHLIHDVLDYSKIENNQIRINNEYFDLNQAVEEIINMNLFQIEIKGINFIYKNLNYYKEIYSDKKRFQQILLNLLSNSLKFTTTGYIKVKIIDDVDNSLLKVSVKDTGIGIKESDLTKLFQAFGMLTQSQKNINKFGSGLGLYLCKALCVMLGGDIQVFSQYGIGSKFIFTVNTECPTNEIMSHMGNTEEGDIGLQLLPITNEWQPIVRSMSMAHSPVRTSFDLTITQSLKKVLVVDDNPFNVFTTTKLLDKLQITSVPAHSGEEAIRILHAVEGDIALVLMDCNMPIMDGLETTREIKSFNQNLNIVGITGYDEEQVLQKCLDSGMSAVYTKPLSLLKLNEVVHTYYNQYDQFQFMY